MTLTYFYSITAQKINLKNERCPAKKEISLYHKGPYSYRRMHHIEPLIMRADGMTTIPQFNAEKSIILNWSVHDVMKL